MKLVAFLGLLFLVGNSSIALGQKVLCKIPIIEGEILNGINFPEKISSIDFLLPVDTVKVSIEDELIASIRLERGVVNIRRRAIDSIFFDYQGGDYLLEGMLVIPPQHNYYTVTSFDPIDYSARIKFYPYYELFPVQTWKLKTIEGNFEYNLDPLIFEDQRAQWPTEYEKQ